MTDNFIQTSFNSGEWSPSLFARVDLAKYKAGAALLENFFVDYRGGASTRPGTQYVIQCKASDHPVRLIPFQASSDVGYVLEFGNQYIRFIINGAPVLEPAKPITNITNGNPGIFTVTAHAYSPGDWIFVDNVAGMTQVNGKYYIVNNVAGDDITLVDLFGASINTTSFNPYVSSGTTRRIYTIASPYAAADLAVIKYAQNVTQMVLCHPGYAPRVLQLISVTNWVLSTITFATGAIVPNITSVTTSLAVGTTAYSYQVTSIDANGQESTASAPGTIAAIEDIRVVDGTNVVQWGVVAGAAGYNVYRADVTLSGIVPSGAAHGFIGATRGVLFTDSNIAPDFTRTPPIARNPFSGGANPAVPGFFQQRLVLADLVGQPQTMYMSQPGTLFNFNISSPTRPDDSITATLVSGQLNTVKALVSQTAGLLVITDRATWLMNGGSSGSAISPSSIVANPQSYVGTNDVPPIVSNFDVLFVQAKGSAVRDNAYSIYVNAFTGTDITALASHLFYGSTILEWAWAEEPFKLVWAVRNDGVMLNLTFLKEQEFVAWTHSVTDGLFKSVATVTENGASGKSDAVYTVVNRSVRGLSVQYIERVADRIFPSGRASAWCVDSGLRYIGGATANFGGGNHLAGKTVTGLADGVVIPPFVMPNNGNFSLSTPASYVTVGLAYTCKLKTLPLDLGEPTVQGKVKKIAAIDVRVWDTLGLKCGPDFDHLDVMKDLIVGNVGSMLTGQQSQMVVDLFSGDARTFAPSAYTVPGQICIQQDEPYPASVLGVIPSIVIGDTR